MNDFDAFLNWYLGERTRMKRGMFNIAFFIAFIPVIFVKLSSGLEGFSQKTDNYAPLMEMAESAMNGDEEDIGTDDIEGFLNKSQKTRDITRQLMRGFNFGGSKTNKSTVDTGINWGDILNLAVFLALIPLVHMRLRDLGKWGNEMWVYTGLIYSGITLDALTSIMGIEFPMMITAIGGILTFILVSWLCMAKSRIKKSDPSVGDHHMPGDNYDDPY